MLREGRLRSFELEQTIKRRIVERTGSQLRSLEVDITDNLIAIRGCVSCYYHKQLALRGVLDVIGVLNGARIELNVEVAGRPTK
jgi:hypothetical protein